MFCFDFFSEHPIAFYSEKMPVSQQYTWGVRLGYLIFLWPLCMELAAQLFMYHNFGISFSRFTFLMDQWNSPVGGLRIAYLMGIFALQILPLTSNYVFKKKREVQLFSLCYFLCMFLLVVMTLLRQPFMPS